MNVLEIMLTQGVDGLKITLSVFVLTLVLSLPLSIVVVWLRRSRFLPIRKLMSMYIYLMRGTPLLLQLMFIFFGLPFVPVIGVTLGRYEAVIIAFVLNYAAYYAEIFRGGIEGVSIGQWEAGKVLGLNERETFIKVIMPQVLRSVMPSVSNEVITLLKDTSLVYVLGLTDVLKVAKGVSSNYVTFTPYIFVGVVYLILTAVLTRILYCIENKVNYTT